jgi:formylglycine-generating enzyme required for sulfatase activity
LVAVVPDKIAKISFVALDGDAPPNLVLDRLPDATAVASVVDAAFAPFSRPGLRTDILGGSSSPLPPPEGLHLIYAYGHAWLAGGVPSAASRTERGSVIEAADQLILRLLGNADLPNTILVLDCCHATAFDSFLTDHKPRLVVYASGADEKAIALHGDKASRLSLAFAAHLKGKSKTVDLVAVVAAMAEQLGKDGVLRGQSVSYRAHGLSIRIFRGDLTPVKRRERTVALIRNTLIATGAAVALGVVWVGWYYWSHSVVELDLAGLSGIADNVVLVASLERPGTNSRYAFAERAIDGNRTRLWVPSDNVLLRIEATYHDGQERALAFHLLLEPGFSLGAKLIDISLPPAEEVKRHPGMAHVPATAWFHGRERTPRSNERSFWIDIRPPTVTEYLPVAQQLSDDGVLEPEGSLLINWRVRSRALDAVGLGQLRELSRDLGKIFGIIDSANSETVSAPGDVTAGLGEVPCDRCPAPMTRQEAGLYCERQGKRLPTNFEWELAVRGVDGRVYPWGNQFDESRANVPGMPERNEASPALKPVDAYEGERSPFGLVDTVGNAGDWVENALTGYARSYMGATYRYNQEDATAFRLLPVTETDSLLREITTRCVAN